MTAKVYKANVVSRTMKKERLDVTYPVIEGLHDVRVQYYINSVLLGVINELIKKLDYYDNPEMTITGKYYIRTNERSLLSLSIEMYGFGGGAHGFTILKSVTFDLRTGKIYRLRDFFAEDVDYVKYITEIVKKQIVEKEIPVIVDFTAISPDQDFYIENNNLVVYFQLYELAPYAWGFPTFEIPMRQVCRMIGPGGPRKYCSFYT